MDDFKEDDNSGVTGAKCQGSLVAQECTTKQKTLIGIDTIYAKVGSMGKSNNARAASVADGPGNSGPPSKVKDIIYNIFHTNGV